MNEEKTLVFHFSNGHYKLLEYGKWTLSTYAAHFLSPYVFEDEEGNTIDENGSLLFPKESEDRNRGSFAFDYADDGYVFVPIDEIADSGNERCYDCLERELLHGHPSAVEAYNDLKTAAQNGDSAAQYIIDSLNFEC